MSKPTDPAARPVRILALCDSVAARPGQSLTGFGRVALNLFSRWPHVQIDVWGIGFEGYGYKELAVKHPHITLIPAGSQNWNSVERLSAFLRTLRDGGYTHCFILMDADAVSSNNFPAEFRRICREKKIESLLYYPVDAPMQKPYDIIEVVDTAVTFTEYGQRETRKALRRSLYPVHVLPHGIDTHFTPATPAERERYRNEFQVQDAVAKAKGVDVDSTVQPKLKPFLRHGDFLILNVNKNEWRKDPLRSLEILKRLRDEGVPAKLVLRMSPTSLAGGVHLERAAEQMGLTQDVEWAHIPAVPEEHLRGLYGSADLYLTTSLGEGWGLGVTEALACGTPVAMSDHTSLAEIGGKILGDFRLEDPQIRFLDLEGGHVSGYDTRLRKRVDLDSAVQEIKDLWQFSQRNSIRGELSPEILDWLSWDRIANEFLKLMGIEPGAPQSVKTNLRVELSFSVQEQTKQPTKNSMLKLTTTQQAVIAAKFETAAGIVVPIAGKPQWTAADGNIVKLVLSDDGLSVTVVALQPGKTTVTVTGEGDPTPGVDTVSTSLDIDVVAPEASQVVLDVGAPMEQPAPASEAPAPAPEPAQ